MAPRTDLVPAESAFDDLFRAFGLPAFEFPTFSLPFRMPRAYAPASEVHMKDGTMVIRLDLPGIDPEKDVKVTVHEGDLVIEGERKQKTEVKEKEYFRSEVYHGYFTRRFGLPAGVDEAKIQAVYSDGVLEIKIPGTPPAPAPKGKTIKVKTGA